MEWIWIGLAVICIASAIYFYWRQRRFYQSVDRMLEEILDNKTITDIDIKEGYLSALSAKAGRIQEKMQIEIGRAEKEKEQVKSLISNMSHQLKTPLANIIMYEDLLEEDSLSNEKRTQFLQKMRNQSEKVDWILNSLFKMVRLEQNAISFQASENPIRPTLLEGINRVYEKAEKKQIQLRVENFHDCGLFHNPKWTAEVFANILENAVKYTPEHGTITVNMAQFELYAQIQIRDTGMGIAQEEMTNLFKRFYRSKAVENIEGSGIGLYLSKLIVEKQKGYINVSSNLGVGSCFSVFLQKCQN